jgi:paraquat-inducible protein B
MRIKTILLGVSLLVVHGNNALAERIYRSVNEKGEVIYSSQPVKGAKRVESIQLQSAPLQADVNAAKRRASRLQQTNKKSLQRENKRLKEKGAVDTKKMSSLAEAKEKLKKAKVVLESDWQVLARGGRHLKAEYFERVKKAEAEYKAAKKGLR